MGLFCIKNLSRRFFYRYIRRVLYSGGHYMNVIQDIFVVPRWVETTFRRSGKPLSDFVSYEVVRQLFSIEDIALILATVNQPEFYLGCHVVTSPLSRDRGETEISDSLWMRWYQSTDSKQHQSEIENIRKVSMIPEVLEDLVQRMFTPSNLDTSAPTPFTIHDISQDTTIVTLAPGYFYWPRDRQEGDDLSLKLVRSILETIHMYQQYHLVASTNWYRYYLRLLSNKKIMV
jgi:hypothetical protein